MLAFEFSENLPALITVAAVLFVVGTVLALAKQYKRCPSNKVLVIYGKVQAGHSSRTLHGGGAFVWPLIQNYAYLSLDPMQIEIPLKGALSAENIRVNVPSVFTVAIGTNGAIMENAAIRLLGLSSKEITHQAADIIFGQLRQVIASLPIEQINRDRDTFLNNIQMSLEPELNKIGLVLINVNITDITDSSGYIEALGQKAASEAIQKAQVDVAEQEKIGSIGVAEAQREKDVGVAIANKVKDIGTQEAERDKAVTIAGLQKERSVAEQKARFETEAQVKESEREMRISIADANAKAVVGENTSKAEMASSNAELKVKEADAFLLGESRKREAAAEVEARQFEAEAKAAEAESRKIEAEKRAELEAPARAQKAMTVVNAEAESERRRIEAEGRAAASRIEAEGLAAAEYARLEAKARGEYEVLAKKADGLRQIVEGCGGVQGAFQLMMLEHLDHLAETSAKALSNIKFDKITVWDSGTNGDGSGSTSSFLRSLGKSIPPLQDIMRNLGGVQLPEIFGRMTESAGSASPASSDIATKLPEKPRFDTLPESDDPAGGATKKS